MFGNLGWTEILLLLLVFLLLFGAKRLPEIGASLGKGIREFKKSISGQDDETAARPASKPELPAREEERRGA
jgi:sec-independent protein translocase protein TatA